MSRFEPTSDHEDYEEEDKDEGDGISNSHSNSKLSRDYWEENEETERNVQPREKPARGKRNVKYHDILYQIVVTTCVGYGIIGDSIRKKKNNQVVETERRFAIHEKRLVEDFSPEADEDENEFEVFHALQKYMNSRAKVAAFRYPLILADPQSPYKWIFSYTNDEQDYESEVNEERDLLWIKHEAISSGRNAVKLVCRACGTNDEEKADESNSNRYTPASKKQKKASDGKSYSGQSGLLKTRGNGQVKLFTRNMERAGIELRAPMFEDAENDEAAGE
jgi:hypothetical protein